MVRNTLQWIATLLILAGLGGGGYAYWLYSHTDVELSGMVLDVVKKRLPNAEMTIGRARFDWNRRVHLYDVLLSAKGLTEPLARFAEVVITLDAEELSKGQHIDVRSIRILRPDVRVIRDGEGHLNWQKILPLHESEDFVPEFALEQIQMFIRADRNGGDPVTFHVQQGEIHLVPSARRAFHLQAAAQVPGFANFAIDGGCDLEKGTWNASGNTAGAADVSELLETFARTFPDSARRVAEFQNTVSVAAALPMRAPPNSVYADMTAPDSTGIDAGANAAAAENPSAGSTGNSPWAKAAAGMTIGGQAEIHFEAANNPTGGAPSFSVEASFAQGEIQNPLLPFALHGVSGKISADQHRLVLRNIRARNGTTQIAINGNFDLPAPVAANRVDIKIQDLLLDRRLQSKLPMRLSRFYELLRPGGQVDLGGAIVFNEAGHWEPTGWEITHKGCSVWHREFPYPITDVVGTSVQQGNSLVLDLHGRAGDRPIRLTGKILNPGPEAEAFYHVQIRRVPIDDTLLTAAAARPPFLRTLTSLRLRGLLDVECLFHRPSDPNQKMEWRLSGRLGEGSLQYEHFPYRIADLGGLFNFDSTTGQWTFRELQGSHGPAKLTGHGTFVKASHDDPGELKLKVHAEEAPLEDDLEMAFPPDTRRLWDVLRPSGKLNTHVTVNWTPGSKPEIAAPEATITDGALEIRAFPYPLDHVTTRFTLDRNPETGCDRVSILSFSGHHDETVVRIERSNNPKSVVLCPLADDPVGEWRVRLEPLAVEDLIPDRALRHALPAGLRQTVQTLNPQGRVDLAGMIELRGTRNAEDPVTAAWSYRTTLSGASLVTGVDLKNAHGSVESRGTWNGTDKLIMEGRVDLDFVSVWNHQFTQVHGPFKLTNQELTVGSAEVFRPLAAGEREQPVKSSERLTARAYDGVLYLDAYAHLDAERTSYRVKAAMQNASLGKYAQINRIGQTLHGVMNGWVELQGNSPAPKDAVGQGALSINPAALYELPVFVQIFKLFSLAPVDKTAFNYALTRFSVLRRQVKFDRIDLVGDALSLRGKGTASFDGTLRLDFVSRSAGRWQIPVFDELTQGWVGVKVSGTVQYPRAIIQTAPRIDEAMQQFFNSPGAAPQLAPPPWMQTFPMMMPGNATRTQSANAIP